KTLNDVFIPEADNYNTDDFIEAFERLSNTGDRDKVKEITKHLVDLLGSSHVDFRQKALGLLLDLIKSLNLVTDLFVLEGLIDLLAHNLLEKRETYEYSEFIWQLLEKCFKKEKFYLISQMMAVLSKRRRFDDNVTIYDSMAVKKVFANFNQPQFIDHLIQKMLHSDSKTAGYIRDILIYDGSEEVALALSNIISHPQRRVRQQALKILAELGKASLKVFSQILVDDDMFEREQDRHELPNNKWYIIRNSIFVLGLLKDTEATVPLRLRINDTDVRVRREIISTLEKIGSEEACDILMMMADDPVKEIREKAVITIGIIGLPETVPLLIDLAQMNPKVVIKAINAMGRIGGEEAENFLIKTLESEQKIIRLAAGMFSKDDIKLAVIKALGNIGSKETINKIKSYRNNLSTAQKIFFKNSPVNKTIEEILSRK
ncbi:MAG: HEAT repeat domain-containing protein, partial [FCB group bacterium]|nr:HEAT repeat domain-containing protein [FCB group bacterium]